MDANSSTQMLSQIFASSQTADEHTNHFIAGNRNQYREIERFDTDAELLEWMAMQGKKWGIVQKGRVTIEDIIDQYACVYRRRKGYACKVQMRVRHNRRTGHKVVEVLELDHDHTFYGYKVGSELTECKLPFSASFPSTTNGQFGDFIDQQLHQDQSTNVHFDDHQQGGINDSDMFRMIKQEQQQQFSLSSLLPTNGEGTGVDNGQQEEELFPLNTQPMEMLLSNILNNAQQQQMYNSDDGMKGHHQEGGGRRRGEQQQQQIGEANGGGGGGTEATALYDGMTFDVDGAVQMMEQQQEALAERVAEKMANYLTSQLEPKFASILSVLNSLTKSVDELKRTVTIQQHNQQQQQQRRRFTPVVVTASSTTTAAANKPNLLGTKTTTTTAAQQPPITSSAVNSNNKMAPKISFRPFPIPQFRPPKLAKQTANSINQHDLQHNAEGTKTAIGAAGGKAALTDDLKLPNFTGSLISSLMVNGRANCSTSSQRNNDKPSISWASAKPTSLSMSPLKFGSATAAQLAAMGVARKSARKSVYAYRQRRRELSYRHMKEIGLTLIINGIPRSIFHCRVTDIATAVHAKRKELAHSSNKVIYRGRDVTDKLYRVDCSRVLVNGRRCGQMVADSLWPRGFFQQRMLMPILRGVNHRTKRRVDGTMRASVDDDQFDVFKEALIRLGGFLIDEQDRYKWMETAREGVNQRGLDELANSKRAHFDFEGGPLFAAEENTTTMNDRNESAEQKPSATVFTASLSALPASLLLGNGRLETEGEEEEGDGMEMMMVDEEEEEDEELEGEEEYDEDEQEEEQHEVGLHGEEQEVAVEEGGVGPSMSE